MKLFPGHLARNLCSPVDRPLSELLQKAIQNISAEIKPHEVSLPDNEDGVLR